MAIFAKDSSERSDRHSALGAAGDSPLSIISAGMTVTGNIDSSGVVKVEGKVEGSIRGARQVLLGRQGEVKGDIHAQEAVIGGRVEGIIRTTDRVEVQGSATVTGDIYTKTIIVLEGARINGQVRMSDVAGANDASAPSVAIVR